MVKSSVSSEMSQANPKTPTMALQEFTVAYGFASPVYVLVMSKIGSTGIEFHYRVNVAYYEEMGLGRSKRKAKHSAASRVLKILAQQGLYDQECNQNFEDEHNLEENFVGKLDLLCRKFKLFHPQYAVMSNNMSLQAQRFTYECKIGSISSQATGSSKKQAKQLAAKNMLSVPSLVEQCVAKSTVLTDKDMKIAKNYEKLAKSRRAKRASNVDYFPKMLTDIMKKKNLNLDDFKEQFQKRNKEGLDSILQTLNVEYKITFLQESPYVTSVVFNFGGGPNTSFTLMAMGSSKESATLHLIYDIYAFLDVYMSLGCSQNEEKS